MTKQEFIRQCWGKYYEKVEDKINENGVFIGNYTEYSFYILDNIPLEFCKDKKIFTEREEMNLIVFFPTSLTGIEDNNGWNKVNSIEDLPKENKSYKTISRKTGLVNHKDFLQLSDSQRIVRDISHWKEIVEDKMPLY